MTEAVLALAGFLFLVVLARLGKGRRRSRSRWPGVGVSVTRGPLTRFPTPPAWSRPFSGPWH